MSSDDHSQRPTAEDLLRSSPLTVEVALLPGRIAPRYAVPLRCGVPLPKGRIAGNESACLIASSGEIHPVQTEVLSRWPDGSVRWMLVDVVLPRGERPSSATVAFPATRDRISWQGGVALQETDSNIVVRDHLLTAAWDRKGGACSLTSTRAAGPLGTWSGGTIIDADGIAHQPRIDDCRVEVSGPLRTTVALRGAYPSLRGLRWTMRHTVFAGAGLMRIDVAWHNPRRARHRGGLWDLGDPGSVCFRSAGGRLRLSRPSPTGPACQLAPESEWIDAGGRFVLHQESSGGEQWNCVNHVDRTGAVPLRYRGFRLKTATCEVSGERATPSVRIAGDGVATCSAPHFWQQFPKSLEGDETGIGVGLFPPRDGGVYELQGGERKTHTIWLKVDPPGASLEQADLSWVHDPPRLVPELRERPVVVGWPGFNPLAEEPLARLDALSDEVLNGPASVFVRREEIDEYGWRNFGDFYADHETAYYRGPPPLISHFNNQYDVLGGLLLQGLRTKDRRWLELAEGLGRHVTDIDLYQTDEDRAVYNGGLFWLTDHYRSCGTATHRCFSKLNAPPGQPYGGGPGCEHDYSTGLLASYWLTGEPAARAAVVQLAEWVIAMDDGRRTIYSLVDDGPTGHATATSQPDYHGPGRGAGNSINALLDAWLLTCERRYLDAATTFLRRCIHPEDDIAARDLLNFELRWSYTVFLMAVYKYLGCKEELGEFDADFEYARQSLLHYARWMLDHERPYFDRAEQMEFPTETWGAQELRKANVLRWAAAYADEPLRSRLIERGDELAERGWRDLCRFETRTFIRPFTLAMIQGLWDAALRGARATSSGRGPALTDWGKPEPFEPQALRVRRMLKSPGGMATALARSLNPRRWAPFVDALRRMM